VKKEVGKVVETSEVPSHKRVLKKGARAPRAQKRGTQKNFEFQNFKTFKSLWRGASVDVGRDVFIA